MDFKCPTPHMYGGAVNVNSTEYPISETGVLTVEDEKDIAKLQVIGWQQAIGRSPVTEPVVPETTPEAPPVPEDKPEDLTPTDKAGEDGADKWPDPTEDMPLAYLREIATAYQVPHNAKTKKATLIKAIMEAMYPE